MADHVRTQCRDAAVAALTGLVTTGSDVYKGRAKTRPLQETDLPALLVYTTETEASGEADQRGQRRMVEVCSLVVEGHAQGTGDVDATLDTIEKEVRAALAADPTLGGKAKDLIFSGSAKDDEAEAEQPTWVIRMTFTIEYHTRETTPDVVLA